MACSGLPDEIGLCNQDLQIRICSLDDQFVVKLDNAN